MIYYRRYVGDYLKKTARLSMLEHGAYGLLLDYYYVEEAPIPLDLDEVHRMVRAITPEEQAAVRKVLRLHFTEQPDGWHNERADEELATAQQARDNGRRGGRPKTGEVTGNVESGSASGLPSGSVKPPENKTGSGHPSTTSLQPTAKSKALSGAAHPDVVDKSDDNPKAKARAAAREVGKRAIEYLNAKAGTKFRITEANLKFPVDRQLVDKATEEDLKAVVDAKIAEATAGKFDRKYLRPETLWNATKFGSYVGQIGASTLSVVKTIHVAVDYKAGGRKSIAEYTWASSDFDAFALVLRTCRNPQHLAAMTDVLVGAVLVYVDKEPGIKGRWSPAEVKEGMRKAA